MSTTATPTIKLPGGFILVDLGPLLDLRCPTPDSSVPYGGLLAGFGVRQEAGGWLVRTRGLGLAYEVADRDAAVAELTRYAADLLVKKP